MSSTAAQTQPAHHSAFRLVRQQEVPSLKITVYEYVHEKTGAQHIHLASDNPENVFLVALRTVPEDSTGVAHILEHTALCGSKKYPVRDPFFMMTRRSINTFMNAFTSSDWTAYPFASVNQKDFFNLLDVYLDAVFFSRLDPLDFAQEGHRLEFAENKNPESELVYKGVVYNEMKGAMSSISSQLWHTMTKYLFPDNTYHYNSGGEPDYIPDLTYEQLLHFYRTHYHPSNATFMTYGNIDAAVLQQKFEEQALKHFNKLEEEIKVEPVKRYHAPLKVQEFYPYNDSDLEKKTHVVLAWLWGKSTNLEDSLRAQLLSSVLMDHSATPLTHALETSDLGSSPSPLCGLDDSQLELSFMCGLEGCTANSAEEVEKLIFDTLKKVAEEGIPKEDIESALHQLELHQREPGGDHYPYGLQMILTALNAVTHRGDPVALLNVDASLEKLRKQIQNPDFIKDLVSDWLLNNPHFVRLTLAPDANMNARKEAAEKLRLQSIKASLNDAQKNNIVELSEALLKRQNQQDDASILPKVTLEDVPKEETAPEFIVSEGKTKLTFFPTGTNGLVYQQVTYMLPKLDTELAAHLNFYSNVVTELGCGEQSYLEIQRLQASVSGGINGFSAIRPTTDDVHSINAFYTFSGKALNRNQQALTDLMSLTIEKVRFDETSRLKELLAQTRASKEQSVTGSGHSLAMLAASAGMCATAKLNHDLGGLQSIKAIKALDKAIQQKSALNDLAAKLASIHDKIRVMPKELLLVCEAEHYEKYSSVLTEKFQTSANSETVFALAGESRQVKEAWLCNSQVNFCAKAYPTVPMAHPDAAPLVILGNLLRNAFLHKAIREQGGAYGGGASQDNNNGAFRFYSYRDPRLADTLKDFDASVQWVMENKLAWEKIEEAILGTISSLDKTESPAGRAKREYHSLLHGRTLEARQRFREQVLATKEVDLKRVAETYLQPEKASTAVICDFSRRGLIEDLGLSAIEL